MWDFFVQTFYFTSLVSGNAVVLATENDIIFSFSTIFSMEFDAYVVLISRLCRLTLAVMMRQFVAAIAIKRTRTAAQDTELTAFAAFLTDFTVAPSPDSPMITTLRKYCYTAP
jgi:hypothetical protein